MFGYRSSNFEQYQVIRSIVEATGCQKYLELGISEGFNIRHVASVCPDCTGVDIKDISKFRDFKFHICTTDKFFETNKETFDVIFIDADHQFEQVKKDFINSLNVLNKFGIIFLHDTDPSKKEYLDPKLCGDSYKMIRWLRNEYYGVLEMITIPVGIPGLTIVNRMREKRFYEYNSI